MRPPTPLLTVGLLGVLFWAPGAAGALPESPVELRYAYAGPASIEGDVDAACNAWGVDLPAHRAGELVLVSQGGRLRVVDTWVNHTRLNDVTEWTDDVAQYESVQGVPVGPVRVAWPASGLATVFPLRGRDPVPLQVTFHSHRLDLASVESSPAGPTGFWINHPVGGISWHSGEFHGWSRRVQSDQDLTVRGDISLRLVEARLTLPDGRVLQLDQGVREDPVVSHPLVPVEKKTFRLQYAFLDLHDARFLVSAGAGTAICGATEGKGVGTATVAEAEGNATVGEQILAFQDKVLSYSGQFAWREEPRAFTPSSGGHVEAASSGAIRIIGLDFQSAVEGSHLPVNAETLSLVALLLLGAVWAAKHAGSLVGSFYARFGPDRVLDHPRRREVREAVLQNPGLTPTALTERLSLPRKSLAYHLQVLARTQKVRLVREGKLLRVWPAEWAPREREAQRRVLLLQRPKFAFVTDQARRGPVPARSVVRGLVERFALTPWGARYVVRRAIRLDLVREESGEGREKVLRCA